MLRLSDTLSSSWTSANAAVDVCVDWDWDWSDWVASGTIGLGLDWLE